MSIHCPKGSGKLFDPDGVASDGDACISFLPREEVMLMKNRIILVILMVALVVLLTQNTSAILPTELRTPPHERSLVCDTKSHRSHYVTRTGEVKSESPDPWEHLDHCTPVENLPRDFLGCPFAVECRHEAIEPQSEDKVASEVRGVRGTVRYLVESETIVSTRFCTYDTFSGLRNLRLYCHD
jgi:hypothetical protein